MRYTQVNTDHGLAKSCDHTQCPWMYGGFDDQSADVRLTIDVVDERCVSGNRDAAGARG